jgi:hypothetical protein
VQRVENPKLPFPLQDGESVFQIARRHWIYLWPYLALQVAIAIIPVLVVRWLLDKAGILDDIGDAIWIATAVWVLFWLVRAGLNWYRYRHDLWTITNQRLIDSYRSHPFDLKVATADLVNVQDMAIEKHGILSTLLDYGDIVCQTASSTGEFRLTGIPKPRETQILVDRERDRERMRTRGS